MIVHGTGLGPKFRKLSQTQSPYRLLPCSWWRLAAQLPNRSCLICASKTAARKKTSEENSREGESRKGKTKRDSQGPRGRSNAAIVP